jgi:FtsP/CotA-like multicopper oxidase with cupredoxin domain
MLYSLVAALACCTSVPSVPSALSAPSAPSVPPTIAANDNRHPAGTMHGTVLQVSLEAVEGRWYPEGADGRYLDVATFAEAGHAPQNPGPLIRVTAGTWVEATVRNLLARPLTLHGFGQSARGMADSVVMAPGASRTVRFQATTPGTYYYQGGTSPDPLDRVEYASQLNGVIVVDPPGAHSADRIFVISLWGTIDSTSPSGLDRATMAINGLSWPHTERLDMVQGDSAHWRVLNLSVLPHPMHLHGFYFRTEAKGDGIRDTLLAPDARRTAVTEIVLPGQTMGISWQASRPGDWIFHCHFAGHLSKIVSLDTHRGELDTSATTHHMADGPHQMFGLVLGIRVKPSGRPAVMATAHRTIRLLVREKPGIYGADPGYAFVLGGSAEDSSGAMPVPGPELVLQRGEPVAITIVNETQDHAAIHWHGIELDNAYADGVPGWSGTADSRLPAIPPGDSLTVHFTPPRAGTFMYHSHFNEFQQIPSGLYGAIVVVDSSHPAPGPLDRTFIFSDGGPTVNVITGPFPAVVMNGDSVPKPMELRAGATYRFRLINIRGDALLRLALTQGGQPATWRIVAKDGADLPAAQLSMHPAALVFAPGEIYDVEFTPKSAGELALNFGDPPLPRAPTPVVTRVAMVVK